MSDADDRKPAGAKRPRRGLLRRRRREDEAETTAAEGPASRASVHALSRQRQGHLQPRRAGRKVTCPWCRGGGERLTGLDAQEFQQQQAALKSGE